MLRDLFDKQSIKSYAVLGSKKESAEKYYDVRQDFESTPTPSWEYYQSAAEDDVPTYSIELAKSGRSKCVKTGTGKKCCAVPPVIAKGEIRIGSIDKESGSYHYW